MDPGQRARLQPFLGEDGELPQDIDNDIYDTMITKKLNEAQKRNYRGLGLGDYLTSQPAFSEAKDFGRLNAREKELEQDMRDLVREGKKYTDPEVVQIGRERGLVETNAENIKKSKRNESKEDFRELGHW